VKEKENAGTAVASSLNLSDLPLFCTLLLFIARLHAEQGPVETVRFVSTNAQAIVLRLCELSRIEMFIKFGSDTDKTPWT
jgi:hypothetical protein